MSRTFSRKARLAVPEDFVSNSPKLHLALLKIAGNARLRKLYCSDQFLTSYLLTALKRIPLNIGLRIIPKDRDAELMEKYEPSLNMDCRSL